MQAAWGPLKGWRAGVGKMTRRIASFVGCSDRGGGGRSIDRSTCKPFTAEDRRDDGHVMSDGTAANVAGVTSVVKTYAVFILLFRSDGRRLPRGRNQIIADLRKKEKVQIDL